MSLPYLCIGLLGLLIFTLGLGVSLARARYRVVIGYPEDPRHPLHKLVRAHANTAEYAPALMLLIYLLSRQPPADWVAWSMAGATLCRLLFVAGLLLPRSLDRTNPLRFAGALGTYLFGAALCLEVLRQALA